MWLLSPRWLSTVPPENYLCTDRKSKYLGSHVTSRERHAWPLTGSHHVSVVRPRSELHRTRLLVEREVLDVYLAKRLVNGRRFPHHFARVVQYGFCHYCHFVVAISTVKHVRCICLLHFIYFRLNTLLMHYINVFRDKISKFVVSTDVLKNCEVKITKTDDIVCE